MEKIVHDIQNLNQINWPTFIISLAVLAIIVGFRKVNRKIPGALIAVVGAIILSHLVPLTNYGVTLLGSVPGGLPQLVCPEMI
jgi:MFS superfamily sulfate permease-like transporter